MPWRPSRRTKSIRADSVLHRVFPQSNQAELGAIRQTLRDLLASRRDKLISSLRKSTLDDVDRSTDTMRCMSLDDGREIWHNSYSAVVPPHHGMSRTIPAVIGNCALSLGPLCHTVCWDAESGKARWLIDLVLDHGATVPPWVRRAVPICRYEDGSAHPRLRWQVAAAGRRLSDGQDSMGKPEPQGMGD